MQVNWDVQAEQDYKFFLKKDRRAIEKIKKLLESLEEKYDQGIGKPEATKRIQRKVDIF